MVAKYGIEAKQVHLKAVGNLQAVCRQLKYLMPLEDVDWAREPFTHQIFNGDLPSNNCELKIEAVTKYNALIELSTLA